ncbi:mycothiol system anti-sigma-R factor [Parenemella sanctibonifatiensis]|uniref:Mycothiol system anti-sigma-R factor n=1 Tax=Parenemella sanctibonifatiensis TaxID=2016505 RepID=A0A255EHB5_9ACTN|nr:mycothiol system anti-sigma-R factor [Parenemella sanctibonifatiensis]OYN90934.1 mycothiol system anti-sigma-R factor [Parenemella sanctibonifatiensis]
MTTPDPRRLQADIPAHVDACADALTNMFTFLDDELQAMHADDIRLHLAACEPCMDAFELETAIREAVRRSCAAQAPKSLRVRITQIRIQTD